MNNKSCKQILTLVRSSTCAARMPPPIPPLPMLPLVKEVKKKGEEKKEEE